MTRPFEIGQDLSGGVAANVAKHRIVRRIRSSPQPEIARQPRPRDHVASSASSALRKASRELAERYVQATIRSHAGSPTPRRPKSITALS